MGRGGAARKSRTSTWWPSERSRRASSRAAPSCPAPMLPEMQSTRCGTGGDVSLDTPMLAVTLALIAAVGYAVASVLQQRAAAAVPSELSMRIGLLTRLLGRPLWLVGVAADITAFAFEAMA